MEKIIKPNKTAFLATRCYTGILFSFLLVWGVFTAINFFLSATGNLFFIFLLLHIAIIIPHLLINFIEYRKREYIIYSDKIIQKGGGLFSDYQTELSIKNITYVHRSHPYFENMFFKTGRLKVESAGASSTEIYFASVDNPEELYNEIYGLMHQNGFNLSADQLEFTGKPHTLAVLFEVFKSLFGGVVAAFYLIVVFAVDDETEAISSGLVENAGSAIFFAGIIMIYFFIKHIFVFLDQKMRVYEIYDNVITYYEGFLTKNYFFMPFENLTDSLLKKTLIDRIFGLYDVQLSTKGAGHEIRFGNLENAQEMDSVLDRLINQKKAGPGKEIDMEKYGQEEKKLKQKMEIDFNTAYTDEFRMNMARELAPIFLSLLSLGLIIGLIVIIAGTTSAEFRLLPAMIFSLLLSIPPMIGAYIRVRAHRFIVKENEISRKYKFIREESLDFNINNVTGFIIKHNFLDTWLKTINYIFWSIGSSTNISFKSVKEKEGLTDDMMSKFGFKKEAEIFKVQPAFTTIEYIKKNPIGFGLVSILIGSLFILSLFPGPARYLLAFPVLAAFAGYLIYQRFYFQRSNLIFYQNYLIFKKGIFFRSFYHIFYDNIKDFESTKYPLSRKGSVKFNVAGEEMAQNNRNKGLVSHHFIIHYADGINELNRLIDKIFKDKSAWNKTSETERQLEGQLNQGLVFFDKPSLGNYLFGLIPALLFLNLMMLLILVIDAGFSLLTIAALIIAVDTAALISLYLIIKAVNYRIENERLVKTWGVFYKKHKSIIFENIDFINTNQRAVNKIFRNGNVFVYTIGSSRAEMIIKNIPKYSEYYNILKEKYKK